MANIFQISKLPLFSNIFAEIAYAKRNDIEAGDIGIMVRLKIDNKSGKQRDGAVERNHLFSFHSRMFLGY